MQTEINPEEVLKAFYRAYADWLSAGAEERMPFTRSYGLCTNLDIYVSAEYGCNDRLEAQVGKLLTQQFRTAGLDVAYPFGIDTYHDDRRAKTQHLNPERIDWVMQHAI